MRQIEMIDLRAPDAVEIRIDRTASGWSLWVNVEDVCVLRIYNLPDNTILQDRRGTDATD